MRKLTLFAAFLMLVPGVVQAKSLEDLLVEKGIITQGEARASSHMEGSKVYWNDGTRLDFDDVGFSAKISTQFRTRYEFTDVDSDTGSGENTSSFEVNTARIVVSGNALHKEFDYKIQVDFKGGKASLKDAYLQWNACDWASLRMGQHKAVMSRQYYTSISKQQFADRSVVTDFFSIDRNQGLTGTIDLDDNTQLSAAVFNGLSDGEGINSTGTDTSHFGVIGIRSDLMGQMDPFSEGDVEHTEDTAINVGAAVVLGSAEITPAGGAGAVDTDHMTVSADFNLKHQGFSFHGEFFYNEYEPDGASSQEGIGFYAQAGYFITPKEWEIAARYGYIDCDNGMAVGNDISGDLCAGLEQINTVDATLNYYWWKHNLKAQIGYAFLNEDYDDSIADDNDNTNRWLVQLSSYF